MHILQRCPTYTPHLFDELRNDPERVLLLTHDEGVPVDPAVDRMYTNREPHDPSDFDAARRMASLTGGESGDDQRLAIGLFYRNPEAPRYESFSYVGLDRGADERLEAIESELDRFAI